jgi:solute carrier family 13 (sodium-dependent dicarboxylate transporter), member 2/3/5
MIRRHVAFACAIIWLVPWCFVELAAPPEKEESGPEPPILPLSNNTNNTNPNNLCASPLEKGDEKGGKDKPSKTAAGRTVGACGFVAILWVSEAIDMPAAALFPAVLFPLLGVLSADRAASAYYSDTIMVFLGSFILSVAMERWNLHRRMALRLLLFAGDNPRRLLGGFMAVTAFLSMWMSNTATTSMMVPLAMTTLTELGRDDRDRRNSSEKKRGRDVASQRRSDSSEGEDAVELLAAESRSDDSDCSRRRSDSSGDSSDSVLSLRGGSGGSGDDLLIPAPMMRSAESDTILVDDAASNSGSDVSIGDERVLPTAAVHSYCKGVLLGVAYSANVGGTATLVGTGPNLVLQAQLREAFDGFELTFMQWFLFAFPLALAFLLIVWLLFCRFYVPRPELVPVNVQRFRDEYEALGPVSFPEAIVLGDLAVMAVLWFSRGGFGESAPGWGSLFGGPKDNIPRDGTVALLFGVLLFAVPIRPSWTEERRVMEWKHTRDLPWGIILVLGGGFCLARACLESGLASWLGGQLSFLDDMDRFLFVSVVCLGIIFTTEVTSNVATANIVLPVLAAIARTLNENPLLFMVPATISCSFAFALPAATPPNALAFTSGLLRVSDMAKPGLLLNLIGAVMLPLWMFSVGLLVFGIEVGETPGWSNETENGD